MIGHFATTNDVTVGFRLFNQFFYTVILHFILQRPELGTLLRTISDDCFVGNLCKLVTNFIIDIFVYIESFHRNTDLAVILESTFKQFRRRFFRIHVIHHNTGIVAAQLERDPFQQSSSACHDLRACRSRARKRNLTDIRVRRQWCTKIISICNNIEHASRDDIFNQFPQS